MAFRADASPSVGFGHMARCLALAGALKSRGAKTLFLCRSSGAFPANAIRAEGHAFVSIARLPDKAEPVEGVWKRRRQEADAAACISALRTIEAAKADWLVVDHYKLDSIWHCAVKEGAAKRMVIDDLADRKLDADLVLDQTLPPISARYRRVLKSPSTTTLLLGPSYALLRPEFLRERRRPSRLGARRRRILICFGGSDFHNATQDVFAELSGLQIPRVQLIAAITGRHPAKEALRKASASDRRFRLVIDPPRIARLMRHCDLSVGGGGVMTWERLCVGLPSIVIALEKNQEMLARFLSRRGFITYLGQLNAIKKGAVLAAVEDALRSPGALRRRRTMGMALVDGRGAERTADFLMGQLRVGG